MSLIKWEPFDDFDRLFRDMTTIPSRTMQNMSFDLAADVYEDGNDLVAEMNLPGLKGEDIDVEVEGDHLRISGKREEEEEKKDKNYYTKEIRRGSFDRVVSLPHPVDREKIVARYENGILKVVMPKKEQKGESKIKVQVK